MESIEECIERCRETLEQLEQKSNSFRSNDADYTYTTASAEEIREGIQHYHDI